eukprot:GEMP01042922.1.p2 GENE.GEMP01042922.1~~GEMP01042922.1.p2  ORF type:complete len:242 (+),score=55.00 GEMP01042922.1:71-796(+)
MLMRGALLLMCCGAQYDNSRYFSWTREEVVNKTGKTGGTRYALNWYGIVDVTSIAIKELEWSAGSYAEVKLKWVADPEQPQQSWENVMSLCVAPPQGGALTYAPKANRAPCVGVNGYFCATLGRYVSDNRGTSCCHDSTHPRFAGDNKVSMAWQMDLPKTLELEGGITYMLKWSVRVFMPKRLSFGDWEVVYEKKNTWDTREVQPPFDAIVPRDTFPDFPIDEHAAPDNPRIQQFMQEFII